MWKKYVTRRLAVQVAQAWNHGWGEAMEKVYGVSVNNTLVFRDNKKTDYYIDSEQHKKYVSVLYQLLKNQGFIKNFHKDAQNKLETILKNTIKKFSRDLEKMDNIQLLDIYKNFVLPNVEQFYIRMWTIFNIGEPLSDVIKMTLENSGIKVQNINGYLLELASPLIPNDVTNERIDLLKISLSKEKLTEKQFLLLLQEHTKKYRHIPMFDFDHEPYTIKHFKEELNKITNPAQKIKEIKENFRKRKASFEKILKNLDTNRLLKNLLYFLKENVFLRDHRDMIRQKLNIQLREFYHAISKKLAINIEQVAILTNGEIIQYLEHHKHFPNDIIKHREKSYLLMQRTDQVEIFSGKDALLKFKKEVKNNSSKINNQINGISGSNGTAKGVVKIVYTNKDLEKINKGDILVSTMTRQDFIPAIRKASALIMDEGSITCHAAIIARELKKPCIVATKHGTKILKDGDIVKVNTSKGIVEILKRR